MNQPGQRGLSRSRSPWPLRCCCFRDSIPRPVLACLSIRTGNRRNWLASRCAHCPPPLWTRRAPRTTSDCHLRRRMRIAAQPISLPGTTSPTSFLSSISLPLSLSALLFPSPSCPLWSLHCRSPLFLPRRRADRSATEKERKNESVRSREIWKEQDSLTGCYCHSAPPPFTNKNHPPPLPSSPRLIIIGDKTLRRVCY